jgi:hypothetical protein
MPRKPRARPSAVIMDELLGEQPSWDLDKHLSGCLVGYQTDQSYGAAVYFALEALWGIAHDAAVRAQAGKLDPNQLNADWIISPNTSLPVPWIWIRALSTAWERYKTEGGPLALRSALKAADRANRQPLINLRRCLMSARLPAGLDRS